METENMKQYINKIYLFQVNKNKKMGKFVIPSLV